MKLATWIFALYLAIGGIVALALLLEEIPGSHGLPHPAYEDMSIGGESHRHDQVIWLGTALGMLQITLFVSMLCLAIKLDRKQGAWMAFGAIMMLTVFIAMVFSYRSLLDAGTLANPPIFLGLPVPTAWMIYGLGLIPLFFVVFYVVQFDSCVLRAERYEKFQQILAEFQRREEDHS